MPGYGGRKHKARPLTFVSALCSLQGVDTVIWMTGKTSGS